MTTLTVLFTDLVGSTALMTEIGPEPFDQLLIEHDALVETAIAAHGGVRVKHTGDGIMAVFTGATEALSGAVAIQQAVERRNRRAGVPFAVRVGLSVGDVTEKDGDYFGTPAVEAARLCAIAKGDQILAAEVVKVLAGSRGDHDFIPLGALDLKGLPPLTTVEVRWKPSVDLARVALPAAFAQPRGTLVGRDAELERLLGAWDRVRSGARQVVTISGEPGIGKTRLVTELARRAHAGGALVLLGRCEDGFGAPYKPFAEALRALLMAIDPTETAAWTEEYGADLAWLARGPRDQPPSTDDVPSTDAETAHWRTSEGVDALLATVAATDPVLVVLDDLHWSDDATLLLLRYLARSPEPAPIMLVGTYRASDANTSHQLADTLADLRRAGNLTHLALSGLSEADTDRLVSALGTDPAIQSLARAIHNETEGNPFFVGEVVAALTETGATDLGALGIPQGVRQVIGQRLARLSEPTQRMLGTAAVIGREFDLDLLAAVTGDDEELLLDRLDEATATALVGEIAGRHARFGFSHALVHATLVDGLGATRRVRLHQRAGEVIERLHASNPHDYVAELAYHFGEAAAAAPTQAVHYALLVSQQARRAGSIDEARAACERALRFLDIAGEAADEMRFEAFIELTWVDTNGPDPARATAPLEEALALARRLDSPERLVRVAAVLPGLVMSGAATPQLRTVLEALPLVASDDIAARALLLMARAMTTVFSLPTAAQALEAEVQAQDASDLAHRTDDAIARILASRGLYEALWNGPRAADAVSAAASEYAACQQGPFRAVAGSARWRGAVAQIRLGNREGADALADSQPPAAVGRAFRDSVRAAFAIAAGRWDDATSLADAALAVAPKHPLVVLQHFEQHSRIRSEQGRTNASLLVRLGEDLPAFPALRTEAALATAEAGDRDTAGEMLDPFAADGFACVPHGMGRTIVLRQLAELIAHVGTPESAAVLHSMLAPYDGQILVGYSGSSIEGAAARGLGQLEAVVGRYDEAEAHYEAALALEAHIRAPVCMARTKYWYARMLVARDAPGDADRAAALLDDVITQTTDLDMTAVEVNARALRRD